ncbi:hypothetical protein BD779DRAFT_1466513 [Infundibulicybe gibba]|nr:hypothetical protein BD779DRAFT_1466513 [Infundibulicybe gibba]
MPGSLHPGCVHNGATRPIILIPCWCPICPATIVVPGIRIPDANLPLLGKSLYERSGADLAFWMQQTRIRDAAALKRHILDVQKKAYEIYGYTCIQIFDFMCINIVRLPAYEHVIQIVRERPDALAAVASGPVT